MHIKKGRDIYRLYDINQNYMTANKPNTNKNKNVKNYSFKFNIKIPINKWSILFVLLFIILMAFLLFV